MDSNKPIKNTFIDFSNSPMLGIVLDRTTTLTKEMLSDEKWEMLSATYDGVRNRNSIEKASVSVINAIITQQRILLSLSRRKLRELVVNDENFSPRNGFTDEKYNCILKVLFDKKVIELSQEGDKKKKLSSTYKVIDPTILSFVTEKLEHQLLEESRFMAMKKPVSEPVIEPLYTLYNNTIISTPDVAKEDAALSSNLISVVENVDLPITIDLQNENTQRRDTASQPQFRSPLPKSFSQMVSKEEISGLQCAAKITTYELEVLETVLGQFEKNKNPSPKQMKIIEAVRNKNKAALTKETFEGILEKHSNNVIEFISAIKKYDYRKRHDAIIKSLGISKFSQGEFKEIVLALRLRKIPNTKTIKNTEEDRSEEDEYYYE